MKKQSQTGFTLIELMITVAIVGILACLAVPAYQNYIVRSQVTEGLNLAGDWQVAIAEFYASNGSWPSTSDLNIMAASNGTYVTGITVASGAISIAYGTPQSNQQLMGAVLTLVPYTNDNDDVLWQCGLAAAPNGSIASGAVPGGTTLTTQQLPTPCNNNG